MTVQILNKVCKAFHLAFNVDIEDIKEDSEPNDIIGWDSLGHATLISELEKVFEVEFDIDEIMEMEDVSSILSIITMKLT